MPNREINVALREATRGLLYQSETDAPFEILDWQGAGQPLDSARLLALTGHKPGAPVEVVALEDFFRELTQAQDWQGEAEQAAVRRYRQLLEIFESQLSDSKAYRIGKTRVEIFILGRTSQGDWAGVKTCAVET